MSSLRSSIWHALQQQALLKADEDLRKVVATTEPPNSDGGMDMNTDDGDNQSNYQINATTEGVETSGCDDETVSRQSSIEEDLSLNSGFDALSIASDFSDSYTVSSTDTESGESPNPTKIVSQPGKKYTCRILVSCLYIFVFIVAFLSVLIIGTVYRRNNRVINTLSKK